MKSKKKQLFNLFVCVSCGAVVIGFLFFSTEPASLAASVRELRIGWLLGAVGCMPVYWLLEAWALHILLKKMDPARRFRDSFKVAMGGQYFNAITPFSTGGQPFQAYALTRQGMTVSDGAVGLLGRFLMYQSALVAVSTVLLVVRLGYFLERVQNFALVVLVGYAVNFAVLAGLLAVGLFRGAAEFVCRNAIRLGGKMRLVKDAAEKEKAAEESLRRFHENFRVLLRHGKRMWAGFFLSVLQLLAYLAVPWFIYRAFGLSGADPLTILGAQGFVMMISSFVPIPGAAVGAEGSFYFFFRGLFRERLAVAMVLWRFITFYLTVVVGAVFALQTGKKQGGMLEKGGSIHEDRSVQ